MPVRRDLADMAEEMRCWRQHFHANPETAYEEHNTSEFIASRLTEWGIDVHRGLACTGVVGTLRSGPGKRMLGLRADMDALNMDEHNQFSHRSLVSGRMHACGHDGHMSMLLGAARYLSRTRNFNGTVHFIFQPAEENEAGARRMMREGLFELFPVDAVFGMHNMPFIPEGKMVARPGPIMASADYFEVTLTGKGAHAAWPHLGIDLISIASELVCGFNHIVARVISPLEPAVISVTRFNAGQSTNVMPELVVLSGTTRTFSVDVQQQLETNMRRLCDGVAAAHGATASLTYCRRYPPTINHMEETRLATEAATRVVGVENVLCDEPPVMGAEDFAWMLREVPGSYVWIGNGSDREGSGCMLHESRYDFNDRILAIGASYWVELAESYLQTDEPPKRPL